MAPLPPQPITFSSSNEPRDTISANDLAAFRLLRAAKEVLKRDLGPTQSQSVGMAVGLSIAGIVVAIFVFGWVRYFAARQHHREGRKAQESEKAAAAEGSEAPAEEAPAE
ncbi:hypothetical protein TWF694_011772 [Orbilia ellipsospora]|uniref:Uncharacterized protein n=1 Tax=Orbilia ellipsospora TaxID=2528407 RepID=A0AAV9X956_9PEZI